MLFKELDRKRLKDVDQSFSRLYPKLERVENMLTDISRSLVRIELKQVAQEEQQAKSIADLAKKKVGRPPKVKK